jgi:hypothetical protein
MLMAIPAAFSTSMKSFDVNWLPWSVLKMSARPCPASASSNTDGLNC